MEYHYDQLNRLTQQLQPNLINGDYFMRINYDENGNILTLQRNGKGIKRAMDLLELATMLEHSL